jgi:hypothetical protein
MKYALHLQIEIDINNLKLRDLFLLLSDFLFPLSSKSLPNVRFGSCELLTLNNRLGFLLST